MPKASWTIAFGKAIRLLVTAALIPSLLSPTFASAEEQALTVQGAQSMRDSLKAKGGSKVVLQLIGGQEVSGKIVEVGDQTVHLSELTGKEFYDALVRLDHISALVIRVRDK